MNKRTSLACGTAVVAALLPVALTATPASAAAPASEAVVQGLSNPFGLQFTGAYTAVVAENASGEVTRVNTRTGATKTLIAKAAGVAGVAQRDGKLFAVIGGPNEQGEPPVGRYKPTAVLRANPDGTGVEVIANLERYELRNNPDGQVQFVDGKPVDALSNPFSMTAYKHGLLIADGGANDVLRVDPTTGRVSTFFVPPTIRTGACEGRPNNPGTTGCDAVPTGVTVANGSVYVSTLGGEAPGAGRVYKLDGRTGKVQRVWGGLTSPTGIAVTTDETVYLSEVIYDAPEGPPGRIKKILPNGHRTNAAVAMPVGLQLHGGDLYATAFSIAGPGAGQVVRVSPFAFR